MRAFVLVAFCLALAPAVFTMRPFLESRLFPVVRDTRVLNEQIHADGVGFSVRLIKLRSCAVDGIVRSQSDLRLPARFEPRPDPAPSSWATQGTRAHAYHRCHPLWVSITEFDNG